MSTEKPGVNFETDVLNCQRAIAVAIDYLMIDEHIKIDNGEKESRVMGLLDLAENALEEVVNNYHLRIKEPEPLACLLKSGGYPDGLMQDISKVQAIIGSIVQIARSNDVNQKAEAHTVEVLAEIAEEALGKIMSNYSGGVYDDDPEADKKEG